MVSGSLFRRIVVYLLLVVGGIGMLLPFYWMVTTALKTPVEAVQFPPTWFPKVLKFSNFVEAWNSVPFPRYFFNTIFIALTVLLGVLITSSLAGFAFAWMEFRGREVLFVALLAMMMVPMPVYIVPGYLLLVKLGWIDTYRALIVPWMANVFSIFLLRQQFKTIPRDLYDAAVIDGCSKLYFLIKVVLPLSRATIVTIAIFSIIGSWNAFIWPLVVTSSDALRPIQVGLAYFVQEQSTNYTLLSAASTFTTLPLVILFFLAQRKIIASFARSGLKE